MKSSSQHLRSYEEISEEARNLEQDPFTTQDIEEEIDKKPKIIGRALSDASESDEYEIERFKIEYGPKAYSFKGRIDEESHLRHVDDLYLSNEAVEKFEDEKEIEIRTLEAFLYQRLEQMGASKVDQLKRTGYIVDHLEERGDLEQRSTDDSYRVLR